MSDDRSEPEPYRWRAAYTVIALGVISLIAAIFLVQRLLSLEDSLTASRVFTEQLVLAERHDCERANLRREQDRFTLGAIAEIAVALGRSRITRGEEEEQQFLNTAEELRIRLGRSSLQPVDCVAAYPLPRRR